MRAGEYEMALKFSVPGENVWTGEIQKVRGGEVVLPKYWMNYFYSVGSVLRQGQSGFAPIIPLMDKQGKFIGVRVNFNLIKREEEISNLPAYEKQYFRISHQSTHARRHRRQWILKIPKWLFQYLEKGKRHRIIRFLGISSEGIFVYFSKGFPKKDMPAFDNACRKEMR